MIMTGRSDVTGVTNNECDMCIPDNLTYIVSMIAYLIKI
jgi:hypothetical protein